MRTKPRSISIASGKGGVGKTTLTANLGIAIGALGHKVTVLDGDIAMANLGIIMGMSHCEVSFLDVISDKAKLEEAMYSNYGIQVVPCGFRFEDVHEVISKVSQKRVEEIVNELLRQTEFLLIDAPAGIADATLISIAATREMLPVCNPTYSSLVDAYKVIRFANILGTWSRGIVTNRVGKSANLSKAEIEEFMGKTIGSMSVLTEIPEDPKVQEAEREGIPVVIYEPECPASIAIHELAKVVTGEADLPYKPYEERSVAETTQRLIRALTGRRA